MKNTKDCDCVAYSRLDMHEHEKYGIQYCPLHAAAPEMLAALKQVAFYASILSRLPTAACALRRGSQGVPTNHDKAKDYGEVVAKVIAHAKGRG